MKILVIDNYDSFTFNLVHIVRELGYKAETTVVRNDQITLEEVDQYDRIILSPGPGIPSEAGIMPEVIKQYASKKPILGVCLGHQAIGEAFGGTLHNLSEVLHGVATQVEILDTEDPIFADIPANFQIGRYHSWVIHPGSINGKLKILAQDKDGQVMAVRHREYPVAGVQFHPESIITEHGKKMIQNWLEKY